MSTEEAGTAAEDNYFAKKRHGAAKAIQDKFRERSGEYAYEKMVIDGDAEERKRAIRLARIREREKELQVLRSLPAESVQNWSDFRRKRASKTIPAFHIALGTSVKAFVFPPLLVFSMQQHEKAHGFALLQTPQ